MTSSNSHRGIARVLTRIAAPAVAAVALAGPAGAATIYQNDFNAGLGSVTTTGSILTSNGVTYLGNLTQGATAAFTVNTAGYTNLKLAFTLYAVLSLDGMGPYGGNSPATPDNFLVAGNAATVFNYSFANYGGTQSYGGQGVPPGSYAPYTGSAACGALGNGCGSFGDATYLISGLSLTALPGGLLTVTFTGNSNQSVGDEFFGIDDIVLTGDAVTAPPTGAVPEPATWATMLVGFAATGAALRRRRRIAVLAAA